jgi:hypothetical protein
MRPALALDDDWDLALMAREEGITPREYMERLLAEQRAYFERVVHDQRNYFEQRLKEHEAHHDRDREANNRAIEEARNRIDSRLQALNELRAEVTEDRGQLVQRGVFDSRMTSADKDRALIRDEVGLIREELARQKGRQAAYAAILAIALVVVPVLVQFLLRQ